APRGARRALPPLRVGAGGSASVDGGLALRRLGDGGVVRNGVLELPHPAAKRAADLRQPLCAEEQERDSEQEHEVRGIGPTDHACTSWIEMSVTTSPATAT